MATIPGTINIIIPQTVCLTVGTPKQAEILCLLARWVQGEPLTEAEFDKIGQFVDLTETISDKFLLRLEPS